MSLDAEQKKRCRSLSHRLKPVVTIAAKGLTEGVQLELDRALEDHELIKIKVVVGDRRLKRALLSQACDQVQAEMIQQIGNTALLYRAAREPDPRLSNLHRLSED